MDLFPGAVPFPLLKVHVDRLVGSKILGEHAPSTATTQNVEDGVDHRPRVRRARTTSGLGLGEQGTNGLPLCVAEIARVSNSRTLAPLDTTFQTPSEKPGELRNPQPRSPA